MRSSCLPPTSPTSVLRTSPPTPANSCTAPRPYIYLRRFTFADSYKVRDLYLRFGKSHLSGDLAAFDYAITQRNGSVDLMLGPEEIAVLQMRKAPPGRDHTLRAGQLV